MQLARHPQRAAHLPSVRQALEDLQTPRPEASESEWDADLDFFRDEEPAIREEEQALEDLWALVKEAPASESTIRLVQTVATRAEALENRAYACQIRAQAGLGKCLVALGEFFYIPPDELHGETLDAILRACEEIHISSDESEK